MSHDFTIVVIGGGIAGISCIETLFQEYDDGNSQYNSVVLLSESHLVKAITSFESRGRQLEWFNVDEIELEKAFPTKPKGLKFSSVIGKVLKIDTGSQTISYAAVSAIYKQYYDKLLMCTGSKPRQLIIPSGSITKEISEKIVIIRDTNTVVDFSSKLMQCRRIVIVGNGGIGLELVDKVVRCEKVWIIRDDSIGHTFFDSGASKFLLEARKTKLGAEYKQSSGPPSTLATKNAISGEDFGPSLGPDWTNQIELRGSSQVDDKLDIIYNDEIADIHFNDRCSRLVVTTLTGKKFDCDLIISAIGVVANPPIVEGATLILSDSDKGIIVDQQMRTSVKNIYAAGDVVSCETWTQSELWFQMRLWVQAKQMGHYAGRCIVEHLNSRDPIIYFNFDCFTHCTAFFGHKLILLGRFNLQHFKQDEASYCEVIARVNPGKDYVKLIIKSGRIIGAVLVGESGLEETIENLIRDQIDVSAYKDHILDGTVDIEDYFD